MLALRRLLVVLCVVLSGVAYALTPGERVVLFSAIKPVWTANFLSPALVASQILPAGLTYTKSGSIPATQYDSTGKLTYGPNNLILYSSNFSNAAWVTNSATVAGSGPTTPAGNTSYSITATATSFAYIYQNLSGVPISGNKYLVSRVVKAGTASIVTLGLQSQADVYFDLTNLTTNIVGSGAANATVTDIGNGWRRISAVWTYGGASPARVYMSMASTLSNQGGLTVGWYYYTAEATYSAVTYETTPRTQDQVITTSAAYYGPRFDYDPSTLAPRGLLVEEARTNVALYSRDMTNAAWVKSSITAALNQTGLDGVANSASSITASGANGTILQTVTLASSQRFYSAYVKRITGSGAVSMTTDNGTTWTAITVTGSWTQVSIPAQTVTNPVFGFKLATNGDAIAVDCNQNEGGAFATSAIITTSTSVQRTADVIAVQAPITTVINSNNGAIITEFGPMNQAGSSNPVILGSSNSFIQAINSSKRYGLDTFRAAGVVYDTNTLTLTNTNRGGITWGPSSYSFADNGNTVVTGSGTTAPSGIMYLGAYNNLGGGSINGYIRSIAAYNQRLPDPTLKARSVVGAPY